MTDRWLSPDQAAVAIRAHVGGSVGRSEAILKLAQASGEVRVRRSMAADDGIPDLRSGQTPIKTISENDLADWLDRHHPVPAAKRKAGRPPLHDWTAVESAAMALMDENGDFAVEDPAWNSQARLEEALLDLFPKMALSTLRERLPEMLMRWRKAKVEN